MSSRGWFLSFEGSEGVGKTTQIRHLTDWLKALGHDVVLTREPGGTEVAERIRELVLDTSLPAMGSDTELLLIYAARAEHVAKVIKPAIAQGKIVISDRFADASMAYQGYGRGIDLAHIEALDQWVLGGFKPDLTLLLDMPVELGMARARARSELDRFEREKMSFFERVRGGYLSIAEAEPGRVKVISADQSESAVAGAIETVVQGLMA